MFHQKSVTSTDSDASQVTVIPAQKSIDSDVMYHIQPPVVNSVLSELESQESFEKNCQHFINKERENSEADNLRPEPFIICREVLQTEKIARTPENQRSEANILDANDVEFADSSDTEPEKVKLVSEADAMTPDEAENLLSTK